ncbi:hypothetical protein D1164_07175 [Mariniphaga sediminis]|uniref:Uncharacterized protein n=1 Tax=Mariniphaga sediminis TaxID=1628158 RepID=A0A399D234_9BACT|nr:hypothetical protein [Mariniphaga sediminis]RIH66035.1 hypothetical protein D1164_07175 [Mariniphaga sediminis]
MELKDLKKTWEQLSPDKELDEQQIREMLRKKTRNLIDRIDRNIRIGFVALFILIVLFILDDFVFAPMLIKKVGNNVEIPEWLVFLSIFSNVLIFTTFIYFVVQYYRVKRSCDISCNLRETLIKITGILRIYQRLFYLALLILTLAMILQFVSGMYSGMALGIEDQGILFSDIPLGKLLLAGVVGLTVLVLTVGGIYLLMRWGFRRLYGNYISKLKNALQELNEIEQ